MGRYPKPGVQPWSNWNRKAEQVIGQNWEFVSDETIWTWNYGTWGLVWNQYMNAWMWNWVPGYYTYEWENWDWYPIDS